MDKRRNSIFFTWHLGFSATHLFLTNVTCLLSRRKGKSKQRKGPSYKSNSANAKTLKSIIRPKIDFEKGHREKKRHKMTQILFLHLRSRV